jgi:hypothetical protein
MKKFVLFALLALLMSASAQASHNDSVPVGLRVSITNSDPASGRVDFDVTLTSISNNKSFASPWLGNIFWYNYYPSGFNKGTITQTTRSSPLTLLNPMVNAISFGDGQVIVATQIPIVSTTGTNNSVRADAGPQGGDPGNRSIARGSFSHTYAQPGNYTIRANAVGNYLGNIASPRYPLFGGNWLTASSMVIYDPNISDTFTRNGSYQSGRGPGGLIFGVSGFVATGSIGSTSGIPTLDSWSRILLGLVILLTGAFVLTRR